MKSPIRISDPGDQRLADYAELRARSSRPRGCHFVCEGRFVVERLLASRLNIRSVVTREGDAQRWESRIDDATRWYVLPKRSISELVGFHFHRGVLASADRPTIEDVCQSDIADLGTRSVMLCDVRESDNMGVLLRSCAAFGVTTIVLAGATADPFSRRVARVSMGSVFGQSFCHAVTPEAWIRSIRNHPDVETIATCLDEDATVLSKDVPKRTRQLIVVGNEANGLPASIRAACDRRVRIPMAAAVDSLNVAAATTVFLHHYATFDVAGS